MTSNPEVAPEVMGMITGSPPEQMAEGVAISAGDGPSGRGPCRAVIWDGPFRPDGEGTRECGLPEQHSDHSPGGGKHPFSPYPGVSTGSATSLLEPALRLVDEPDTALVRRVVGTFIPVPAWRRLVLSVVDEFERLQMLVCPEGPLAAEAVPDPADGP